MRNNKRVVLMVEDDKKLREVLTKFLSRNDYEVLAAENGKVGLELFYENSKNLDIVLLDGMLPDIDGGCFERNKRTFAGAGYYVDSKGIRRRPA